MKRQTRDLVKALYREGMAPTPGKGGWPARIRRHQALMVQAANALARWGRPTEARRAQPSDLFAEAPHGRP